MSNICDNTFYAYSEDPKNIKAIEKFFTKWKSNYEVNDDSINVYFESSWDFPENEMKELYESIPNKNDIYMRCLSVEYGLMYHALWECDENGWKEV